MYFNKMYDILKQEMCASQNMPVYINYQTVQYRKGHTVIDHSERHNF
jgi:hypothetical protein